MGFKSSIILAALALMAANARAGFTLVEDFNALAPGSIHGQHGWTATGGAVVADSGSTNRALSISSVSGNVFHALEALSIASQNTGTLYFRMRWPGAPMHAYAGLTDVPAPAGSGSTSDYETQIGTDAADSSRLKVRDAGGYNFLGNLEKDVWYRVWMVHDNARDLYAVHIQGGAYAGQARLSDASGQDWFTFRNTSGDGLNINSAPQSNPLITIAFKSGSSHAGPLYVDDIYVDPERENLAVPEPLPADRIAPTVFSVSPSPGSTLAGLGELTVVFSEEVLNAAAANLMIDGVSATNVVGKGASWIWQFAQPESGSATVTWTASQGIRDLAANRFVPPSDSWQYDLLPPGADTTMPTVAAIAPAPGALVWRLDTVQVLFSEPVAGVGAEDLLVNGSPAMTVSGSGFGPYHFSFPQPSLGSGGQRVLFQWAPAHGIQDASTSSNAFAGGSWTNTLVDASAAGGVVINEFLASNTSGLRDEDGDLSGWIELFNPGPAAVNLAGWSLTDDPDNAGRWVFPPVTLAPARFLVVFASGKDRRPEGGAGLLHTNFKLSPYGEYLGLFRPEFPRPVAAAFAPAYPGQRNGWSYGANASGQWRYYAKPTPGAANGDSAIEGALGAVHFSVSRGLFSTPFELRLTPPEPDATIRFTTDGSEPAENNGARYAGPILVSTTTLVRAAAFRTNSLPSRTSTATYIFPGAVLQQPDGPPGFPVTTLWSQYGWPSEYGVEPAVVNDPLYASALEKDLQAIPTLSVVLNVEDMFGAANGIYTHASLSGPAWERSCSVELIQPDGSPGFQADAGIQMHGGGSRMRTQKHPFRIQFKGKYGPGKLRFPFFPDSPVKEFDAIDLRSEYNNHWNHGFDASQRARGTLVRDAWCKDVHAAMGNLAGHSRYVHLYINGLYWGVYNPCERLDGSFGASYLGGKKENYDVFNGTGAELVSGTANARSEMLALSNLQDRSQYERMKQYLDVTQYADYMLLLFYAANQDWGVSKNWYCLRKREPGAGFQYLCWDNERVMEGPNQLPMGVSSAGALNSVSPDNLQAKLVASPEYRLLFADRVQKHLFNGGVLTPGALKASWQLRASQIDRAIVGESARWGAMMTTDGAPGTSPLGSPPYSSYKAGAPYTRDVNWLGAQDWLYTQYFPARGAVLLNQLRSVGLYPSDVMPPEFSQYGGRVPKGFALSMSAANAVFFTIDGSDPRVYGSGAVAFAARRYTAGIPLVLGGSTVVKARGLSGTSWSALVESVFVVGDRSSPLRISELMYHPVGGSAYEYLELFNTGSIAVDLGGFSFEGIDFVFAPRTVLGAGGRLVLANNANPSLWSARYPGVAAAGHYGGQLDNAGERLALLDASGKTVFSTAYSPAFGWPAAADGFGCSLELLDPDSDAGDPAAWQASVTGGTPGQPPEPADPSVVVLSEIMAWSHIAIRDTSATPDWVELHNAGDSPVDLEGWSLSDIRHAFVLPATILEPGAFLVVWCDEVPNAAPGLHAGFALDKAGGDVFLIGADGKRVDAAGYGPQVADYSIARDGAAWRLARPTPGSNNIAAVTAPASQLSINEWLASPGDAGWIELFNRADDAPAAVRGVSLETAAGIFPIRSLSFIPPRGWLRLAADQNAGPDHLDLHLPGAGGTVSLYDENGALIDQVACGPQAEGVSQGRLPDGAPFITRFPQPTPGAGNVIVLAPKLGWKEANAGGITLTFAGQNGFVYALEKSTNLTQWTLLATQSATGETVTCRDAAPADAMFYRVRWVP